MKKNTSASVKNSKQNKKGKRTMSVFDTFNKKHDYLICVDSDGCVMDTMNCKHFHCFGPCLVTEWGLENFREPVLFFWNEVSLYQITRGINRFHALVLVLQNIHEMFTPIEGLEALKHWSETTSVLSSDSVRKAVREATDPVAKRMFEHAFSWSNAVNAAIAALPKEDKLPYNGAAEALAVAHTFADIAIVSSTHRNSIEEEWSACGLLSHTDIILAQDCGSKAHCIARMLQFGYSPDKVLMVGDSPIDADAAKQNGVLYYPILINKETESWQELQSTGLVKLQNGTYRGDYQKKKEEEFLQNLGG